MSFVSQFLKEVRPQIDRAVDNALPSLAEGLKKKIKQKADSEVYSYAATASAMAKRRHSIAAAGNMAMRMGYYQVEIENQATMQGGDGHEVEMVEEGWGEFRQPYPRPFMDMALDEYVTGGEGDATLAEVLRSYGFTVI